MSVNNRNSFDLYSNSFSTLLDFAVSCVFIDKYRLDLYETTESIKAWKKMEAEFLSLTDTNALLIDRINHYISLDTELYKAYDEKNNYLVSQLKRYDESNEFSVLNATYLHFRLLPDFTLYAWEAKYGIEKELRDRFVFNIKREAEDLHNRFHVEYYKNSEIYKNLTSFFIIMVSVLKTSFDGNDANINLLTSDAFKLNNFLVSQGFFAFNNVPQSKKSLFAINLLKLYQTKGTLENIKLLSEIFNGSLEVDLFNLYLYFDKVNWVSAGSPPDKTGFYKFVKVSSLVETETPFSVISRNSPTDLLPYNVIVDNDPTWLATENQLFDADIKMVKTKFIFLERTMNLEQFTLEMSVIHEFISRFYNDTEFNIPEINEAFSDFKFTNYAAMKRQNMDSNYSDVPLRDIKVGEKGFVFSDEEYERIVNSPNILLTLEESFNKFRTEFEMVHEEILSDRRAKKLLSLRDDYNAFILEKKTDLDNLNDDTLERFLAEKDEARFIRYRNDEKLVTIARDNYVESYANLTVTLDGMNLNFTIEPSSFASDDMFVRIMRHFMLYYAEVFNSEVLILGLREIAYSCILSDEKHSTYGYLDFWDNASTMSSDLIMYFREDPSMFVGKFIYGSFRYYFQDFSAISTDERGYNKFWLYDAYNILRDIKRYADWILPEDLYPDGQRLIFDLLENIERLITFSDTNLLTDGLFKITSVIRKEDRAGNPFEKILYGDGGLLYVEDYQGDLRYMLGLGTDDLERQLDANFLLVDSIYFKEATCKFVDGTTYHYDIDDISGQTGTFNDFLTTVYAKINS